MASQISQFPSRSKTSFVRPTEQSEWGQRGKDLDKRQREDLSLQVEHLSAELAQILKRLGYYVDKSAESTDEAECDASKASLIDRVERTIFTRQQRVKFFPAELFADPAWDMLIGIFLRELNQQRTTVSSLCVASQVPPTTALRWIRTISDRGMFTRRPDPVDGRRIFVELTDSALTALHAYFASAHK